MSTPTPGTPAAYRCSFCGKRQEQVDLLIAGTGGAYICDECVELVWELVQEVRAQEEGQRKPRAATDEER